jgi:hypothetical protein
MSLTRRRTMLFNDEYTINEWLSLLTQLKKDHGGDLALRMMSTRIHDCAVIQMVIRVPRVEKESEL